MFPAIKVNGILRDEGGDFPSAALMEPLTLLHEYCKAATIGTDHRVNLVYLPNHFRPALRRDAPDILLDQPERQGT
jgi:hypothetical protein